MSTRTAVRLAWALWALTVVVLVPGVVLWAVSGFPPPPGSESVMGAGGTFLILTWMLTYLMFASIGGIIASRRPHNPIGWLCSAAGLMMAVSMLASEYASSVVLGGVGVPAPGAAVVAWGGSLLGVWLSVIVPLVLLFPDGRLPGRRWAAVLWTEGAVVLGALLALALKPGPLSSAPALMNPFGIAAADDALAVILRVASVGLLAC